MTANTDPPGERPEAHQPDRPPRRQLDLVGAAIQGLIGGLLNGHVVGAAATAARDLSLQRLAHDTADRLAAERDHDDHNEHPPS
jgi:hypothetical protein